MSSVAKRFTPERVSLAADCKMLELAPQQALRVSLFSLSLSYLLRSATLCLDRRGRRAGDSCGAVDDPLALSMLRSSSAGALHGADGATATGSAPTLPALVAASDARRETLLKRQGVLADCVRCSMTPLS